MKNNKGETLISVLIGLFIVTIIIFGIISALTQNFSLEDDFVRNNKIFFLKNNTTNIIKGIETSTLKEGDIFYLYKTGSEFQMFTGVTMDKYKYVDEYGNNIFNTGTYHASIYTRILYVDKQEPFGLTGKNQVLKVGIKELIKK
ncbi:MAG: hypothetical protein PHS92_02710 [Candidatus Gracilibacteria bacterium]|nr:hypothetical protein [Candidatus Gracilibacteria bacterium]